MGRIAALHHRTEGNEKPDASRNASVGHCFEVCPRVRIVVHAGLLERMEVVDRERMLSDHQLGYRETLTCCEEGVIARRAKSRYLEVKEVFLASRTVARRS